jgi:two-component system cell cycle response regulator
MGVLCLYLPLGATIESKEMELLQALGNQIGTGIDNARVYEEAKGLALHDPLTGLANRRYLELTFTENLARARRHGAPFAIIMFDIDYFKKYNDTYGHDAGDEILVTTARVVTAQVRGIDFLARYGGEEFILLLPDTTLSQGGAVAEKVRQLVESAVGVTISLGMSAYDAELANSKESMINQADKALYRAKGQGRNQVVLA